jgi:hypothetical protein
MRVVWMVIGSLGLGACVSDEPVVQPRAAAVDALRSDAPPRRGRVRGGERVRRVAQWPSDDDVEASVVAMLPSASRAAIDEVTLPVLASKRPGLASSTRVMPGKRWYATWSQHEGLTVTLNASGEARIHPHVRSFPGNARVREHDAFVTQNEMIWSVTWVEHGIAYDLSLECESPTMPPCQDGAYAVGLAEDLAYVGPREAAR